MNEWDVAAFGELYAVPSKNGIMAPARVRGDGFRLVNMKEIFAYDLIGSQTMELAPIPGRRPQDWLVEPGDLLFARQSLTLAGAGKVSFVEETPEPTTFESHIIRVRVDQNRALGRFYYYLFRSSVGRDLIESIVEQVAAAGIRASDLAKLLVPVPPLDEQRRIAGALGALDDLIETDRTLVRDLSAVMGSAYHRAASRASQHGELRELVASVSRGVGPKYSDATDSVEVLNQKCIRDGLVSLRPARRMTSRTVRTEKVAAPGDTLVNSTGAGTLGRAARWMGTAPIYVDSHVSVVKSRDLAESGWVARALIESQEAIEELGSGSTGQTELSSDRLLSLRLSMPSSDTRSKLGEVFDELDASVEGLNREIADLGRVRDELLPLLMSGRVRAREVA